MRGETHEAFRERCAKERVSMAGKLGDLINFYLDIHDAQKKADSLAANRTVAEMAMSFPQPAACPGPHCTRPHCTCVCHEGA